MGLNPLRYVVVPNVLAALLALPVLTVVFDVIGILGRLPGWRSAPGPERRHVFRGDEQLRRR